MKTRQLLLGGLLTLGLSSMAMAQDDNPGGFGIKGGVGFSTISFGDGENTDEFTLNGSDNTWKVGGLLGVSYEARMGNVFALDIEALLANKGVKNERSFSAFGNSGNISTKVNLITVDVPISAKIYLGDNFNFYAGPYFSYIIGGATKIDASYGNNNQTKESKNFYGSDFEDVNGELPMNRFDFGANIGLEFVSDGGFGIGARFQKGFMDLTNDDYEGTLSEDGLIFPADNKFVSNTGVQLYGIFRF